MVQSINLMSAHGGTVECYCLMQVIRGAEACTLPTGQDAHNVLRLYRAQSSTNRKASVEPDPEGKPCTLSSCFPHPILPPPPFAPSASPFSQIMRVILKVLPAAASPWLLSVLSHYTTTARRAAQQHYVRSSCVIDNAGLD